MEMAFRDGPREVPDHLYTVLVPYADRMYRITYAEACEFANKLMVDDLVSRHMDRVIADHFKNLRF